MQQWSKIYEDQAFKDVEITLCDGEIVMADSLLLKMASPVFKAMLSDGNGEGPTTSLQIEEVSSCHFRFFMRLLYTGLMNPMDWLSETEQLGQGPQSVGWNPFSQGRMDLPLHHSIAASQGFKGASKGKGKAVQTPQPVPPLDFLLAAAAIAKKYQVECLLAILVDVLKQRIVEQSFERILLTAMQIDLSPVRLSALEFAKGNSNIRARYNAGNFPQEVMM